LFDFLPGQKKPGDNNDGNGNDARREAIPIFSLAGAILIAALLFSYGKLQEHPVAEPPPVQTITIVLGDRHQTDPAVALALTDLEAGLKEIYGLPVEIVKEDKIQELPPYAIVIGDKKSRWIKSMIDAQSFIFPEVPKRDMSFNASGTRTRP